MTKKEIKEMTERTEIEIQNYKPSDNAMKLSALIKKLQGLFDVFGECDVHTGRDDGKDWRTPFTTQYPSLVIPCETDKNDGYVTEIIL